MSTRSTDPRVIHERDSIAKRADWSPRSEVVTTINLGRLDANKPLVTALPPDLAARFPNLTHLRLWGLDVRELPVLPEGLKWLEVRKCPNLTGLRDLPAGLEVLVLEALPKLAGLSLAGTCERLWDLSLKNCPALPEAVIQSALEKTPNLRELDLSGTAIKDIRAWPARLERIELNRCEELSGLPARWPAKLRRLGLRGANKLKTLAAFKSWPDYLDLAGTASLSHLPEPSKLRSLFLYGSGVLVPPASEHGRTAGENVAERTLCFFADQRLCGRGEVKRCKLLMLGNGDAGKTSLSLALIGEDASKVRELGSTHGVQFWDQPRVARVGGVFDQVQVQIWDFGGQEIYHQTHQLFMSRGAVFLVLWDPTQDGKEPKPTGEGYQDVWRPLQYWLDFIHLACPWKPHIAIVCSGHSRKTDALEKQWKGKVSPRYQQECRCFYVDSWTKTGELEGLEEWLEENIGTVVSSQGTAVPSYWEIAQDMVSGWIQDGSFNEMSREDFERHLRTAIEEKRSRHDKLDAALRDGSFALNEERLRRTLEFLTNSGWIYWDAQLFRQRAIIGQKWALDGIYSVLDRRERSDIFRKLARSDGMFSARELDEWVWSGKGYSHEQQALLLSFMQQVGVCFALARHGENWWKETLYSTFMHLPTVEKMQLQGRFCSANLTAAGEPPVRNPRLHRGHWNQVLKSLGEIYGTDGSYAADGFELINKDGQHVCLIVDFNRDGLGGEIHVQVSGKEAKELAERQASHVRRFLPPDYWAAANPEASDDGKPPAGERPNRIQLFLSYAWNPRTPAQAREGLVEAPVPLDYEKPVEVIHEALQQNSAVVEVLRDKSVLKDGDDVMEYINLCRKAHKVLVVHSDKYWRSPFCLYELTQALRSCQNRPGTRNDVMMFLEMPSSKVFEPGKADKYLKKWNEKNQGKFLPAMMTAETGTTQAKLMADIQGLFLNQVPDIHSSGHRRRWDANHPEDYVKWVKERLGLESSRPRLRD